MEREDEPEGIGSRLLRIGDLGLPTAALLGLSYATLLAALVLHATTRWFGLGARIAQLLPIVGWVFLALPIFWLTSTEAIVVWILVVFCAFAFLTYFPEPLQFNLLVGNPALVLDPLLALTVIVLATQLLCLAILILTRLIRPIAFAIDRALRRAPRTPLTAFLREWLVHVAFGIPLYLLGNEPLPTYAFLSFLTIVCVFFSAPNDLAIYSEATPADALRTHLANVSLLLIPVLFLAGSDYAEIAHAAASRIGNRFARTTSGTFATIVAALASFALALFAIVVRGPYGPAALWLIVAQAAAVALSLGIATALWHRSSRAALPNHIPQATLVAVALGFCVLFLAITYGPDYVGSTHTYRAPASNSAPAFTIRYPASLVLRTNDLKPYGAQTIAVFLGVKDDRPDVSAPYVLVAVRPAGGTSTVGPWNAGSGTLAGGSQRYAARAWFRTAAGREWAIVGLGANGADVERRMPLLAAMRDSWQLGTSRDTSGTVRPAILAVFVLVASVFAVTWRRGRFFRSLSPVSRLFLAAFGSYNFIELMTTAVVEHGDLNVQVPLLDIAALMVALASIVLARRGTSLVALNLAMIVLVLLDGGFNVLRKHEDVEILRAIVVATALTWDLAMSGGTFTNRGSATFPRTARVLLFGGYVVMVAACTANGAPLHIIGATVTPFDSDAWAIDGLNRLGVPLLLTLFATHALAERSG